MPGYGFFTRQRVLWIVRIALTILFVYIVNRTLTESDIGMLVRSIRPAHALLSFLLGLTGLFCQILRWQIILRYQQLSSSFYTASKTIFLGSLLAFVTPGRFGELFRGLTLSRARKADTIFAVVIDKVYILLATFIVGIACAFIQIFIFNIPLQRHLVVLGVAAIVVCAVVALILIYRRAPGTEAGILKYAIRFINSSPRLFTRCGMQAFALSMAAHVLLVCQTLVLVAMFGCSGIARSFIAVGQAYAFMAFVPIFIANMGIREYSFGVFLLAIGAGCGHENAVQGAALGVSMGILVFNLILPALAGLIWNVADTSYEQD